MGSTLMITTPRPRPALAHGAEPFVPQADRSSYLRLDLNEDLSGPLARVPLPGNSDLASYATVHALCRDLAQAFAVSEDRVAVTAGADEAIYGLLRAYLDPGDSLLLPWPTFGEFAKVGEGLGAASIRVPYPADLAFPLSAYAAALRQGPRLAVLVSPANPTGELIPSSVIAALAASAPETLVVVDEAYAEYAGSSILDNGPLPPNVAVIRTFSKAYGLAGVRIGYVIAHPEILYAMRQVLPTFSPALPSLLLAQAGLARRDRLPARARAAQIGQARIARWCAGRGIAVHRTAANFVLLRLPDSQASRRLAAALAKRGVLVGDRNAVLPGALRVTVGAPRHTRQFLAALDAALVDCL